MRSSHNTSEVQAYISDIFSDLRTRPSAYIISYSPNIQGVTLQSSQCNKRVTPSFGLPMLRKNTSDKQKLCKGRILIAEKASEIKQQQLCCLGTSASYISLSYRDLLSWGKANVDEFPSLSWMAWDVLSIPLTSVSVERALSSAKDVIPYHRNWLSHLIIEQLLVANAGSKGVLWKKKYKLISITNSWNSLI